LRCVLCCFQEASSRHFSNSYSLSLLEDLCLSPFLVLFQRHRTVVSTLRWSAVTTPLGTAVLPPPQSADVKRQWPTSSLPRSSSKASFRNFFVWRWEFAFSQRRAGSSRRGSFNYPRCLQFRLPPSQSRHYRGTEREHLERYSTDWDQLLCYTLLAYRNLPVKPGCYS